MIFAKIVVNTHNYCKANMNATDNAFLAFVLAQLKDFNSEEFGLTCIDDVQVLLYHVANALFLMSFASPNTRYGQVRNSETQQWQTNMK